MTTNTYLLILLSLFGCGRVEGTLTIISDVTNETVFSAEEGGVDSTSAYGLMVSQDSSRAYQSQGVSLSLISFLFRVG